MALFDTNDALHSQASEFLRSTTARLTSTLACLTEAMYLLDFSRHGQTSLLEWISRGGLDLEPLTSHDLNRISELINKYSDLPMDFADGALVAVCERLNVRSIATFDSDFDIYRFKGRWRFINVLK